MSHPSSYSLAHQIEQQTRLVRGLMAAPYAGSDAEPDESLLRGLAEAKATLRERLRRRDAERAEAEKAQAGPKKTMGVALGPETTGLRSSRRSGSSRSPPASTTCSTRRPTRC